MTEKKRKTGSKLARKSAARLAAVQAVYQMRASGQEARDIVNEYIHHRFGQPVDGQVMVSADEALFSAIVSGVEARKADLSGVIEACLAERNGVKPSSGIDSVEPLLASVLLCGVYELMAHHETDSPVIIADYLDVTHAFYEGGESKLVNAVLDRAGKGIRDTQGNRP